ncbi:hypothetical protein LCGC14_0455680 [marine sediment metagenome]|uniref:Uncharacterized protein n=1 Tax=marine sediment metagenome TaxID=412755 RepID=A0A0F9SZI6_9ZZZZ
MIKGFRLVRHFDPDFTPCGCVTHLFYTVDCGEVYEKRLTVRVHSNVYLCIFARVCAACGAAWSSEAEMFRSEVEQRLVN